MKRIVLALALVAAAILVSRSQAPSAPQLDRPGDWFAGLEWVQPDSLSRADIEGRIVLVEFWTFGCINCTRTIPAIRALQEEFGDDVLIVGIHTPEFPHEHSRAAVERAIEKRGIRYAVAQDNDLQAWEAFDNHYWPALYLLDRDGRVRHVHIGELHEGSRRWDELVQAIELLRKAKL